MSVFGIVCETNPIHNGHAYLINKARELGADAIVCVMSGNTVQRGEFAITDKYTRAEALLRCGVDLVIELPYPWASSSAEYFAKASIAILSHFCDAVIFGSERGDISIIQNAAYLASDSGFKEEFRRRVSEGEAPAQLYNEMLFSRCGFLPDSNDILGIEYIKAAVALSAPISFKTVKRCGDGYTEDKIINDSLPSAAAVRKLWGEGKTDGMERYMPKEAVDVYRRAFDEGRITDHSRLDLILLSFFRAHNGDDLENIVGVGGGIANRICGKAHIATSAEELFALVKNKRYTDANLRRAMLYCLSGVTEADLNELPCEALLLAVNGTGRELLSANRRCDFKVITKPADLDMSLRQNILMNKIDAVFTLLGREVLPSAEFTKKKPYIEI